MKDRPVWTACPICGADSSYKSWVYDCCSYSCAMQALRVFNKNWSE